MTQETILFHQGATRTYVYKSYLLRDGMWLAECPRLGINAVARTRDLAREELSKKIQSSERN